MFWYVTRSILRIVVEMKYLQRRVFDTVQFRPGWAGLHFDISIIINKGIRKVCVNRGYTSISIRMAIAQAKFASQESKMADNEVEIGFLLLLSRRKRRRLLMQRQTQIKPR